MKKLLLLTAVLTMFSFAVKAAPEKQPTLAVLPFQVSPFMQTLNIGNLQITRQILEREFSNQLIEFLVKSRKFNVLNRTDIQRIIDENKLTESEWAKPGQEKLIGKLLVADYLVTGVVNRLEFSVVKQNIQLTGETSARVTATFKYQFKVTQVSSGKVVAADQVIEKLKSQDVRREIPVSERRDWTLSDYKDLLFKRAAEKGGNEILAGIYPVKIASVTGNSVMLNRGKGAGIEVGQVYTVFNPGETVTDPDTGEVLGSNEEEAGTVEITAVNPKFSKGKIIKGEDKIKTGAICRKEKKAEKEEAPAYPRATPGW